MLVSQQWTSQSLAVSCIQKVFNNLGVYNESFLIHEDKEFRNRFDKKYNMGHLPIPLYRYRRREANITNDQVKSEYYQSKLNEKSV